MLVSRTAQTTQWSLRPLAKTPGAESLSGILVRKRSLRDDFSAHLRSRQVGLSMICVRLMDKQCALK